VQGVNAHKIETILSEDGTLMLQGLPFNAGDEVEVIILERSPSVSVGEAALKGLGESRPVNQKKLWRIALIRLAWAKLLAVCAEA
jgi:hypothetical protein